MFTKNVTITNTIGLHARPATFFIQKANSYKCSVWVEKDERRVNAKSIMGVMTLGLNAGEELAVTADGEDEQIAVDNIEKFLSGQIA